MKTKQNKAKNIPLKKIRRAVKSVSMRSEYKQNGTEPLGLTNKEVKEYLTDRIMKKFSKWISGQTGTVLPNGELGYFRHDIERFADMILDRKPTYWD